MTSFTRSVGALAIVALGAVLPSQQPGTLYSVVDLGFLPGDSGSRGRGINAAGDVVGTSSFSLSHRAFLYTDAQGMTQVPTPPGSTWAFGVAINDSGQVAMATSFGACSGIGGNPYLWSASAGLLDLGSLYGGVCDPLAMNNLGQVVGFNEVTSCQGDAFLYSPGAGMVSLTAGQGGGATWINDAGMITGNGPGGAFRYVPGQGMQWLVPNGTFPIVRGQAMDGAAVIGGVMTTNNGHVAHLFHDVLGIGLIDDGLVGKRTAVRGVSPSGTFVGTWDDDNGTQYGFVWQPGSALVNLNTRLVDPTWHIREAMAINDNGQIVAFGWQGFGSARALRLDPVPMAQVASVGPGCGGGAGSLTSSAPVLGTPLQLIASQVAPGAPVLFAMSLGGPVPIQFAGCPVYLDLAMIGASQLTSAGPLGVAAWGITLPSNPAVAGTLLTAQHAVLAPGLVTGNGLGLVVGY